MMRLRQHETGKDLPTTSRAATAWSVTAPNRKTLLSAGLQRVGVLAIGAVGLGAVAFGALAIGRVAIGRARVRRLEIDELVVHKLLVIASSDNEACSPAKDA
jgi:hypothetical protein